MLHVPPYVAKCRAVPALEKKYRCSVRLITSIQFDLISAPATRTARLVLADDLRELLLGDHQRELERILAEPAVVLHGITTEARECLVTDIARGGQRITLVTFVQALVEIDVLF